MRQREEIREAITAVLEREGQMSKKDLIYEVYVRLAVPQTEICSEWTRMKKEGLVYCVSGLSGWVGIY